MNISMLKRPAINRRLTWVWYVQQETSCSGALTSCGYRTMATDKLEGARRSDVPGSNMGHPPGSRATTLAWGGAMKRNAPSCVSLGCARLPADSKNLAARFSQGFVPRAMVCRSPCVEFPISQEYVRDQRGNPLLLYRVWPCVPGLYLSAHLRRASGHPGEGD